MRIVINKNDFSGIGTAVFYKKHKFFPSDINIIPEEERDESNFTSDLVKYHGNKHNFPSINFAEYDFSYLVNKYKFDNRLLIADLDIDSQELIGKDINNTNKIDKILFPTFVEEDDRAALNYFGSMEVNSRNIFFFETPENYNKIEIYDSALNSNIGDGDDYTDFIEYDYLELSGLYEDTRITPAIVIYLGPENNCLNNPTNMYYDNDEMRILSNRRAAHGERKSDIIYSRLIDEIMGMKVVYMLIATNNAILDFNVAFSAWNNNENPHRNKWKYNIRNDEYGSVKHNVSIVEDNNGIYIDKKSDTILGNLTIDSACPIKTKKLNKLYSRLYSYTQRYNQGEEVIYLNQIWISAINNNLGNYPNENSSYWSLVTDKEYPSQYYSPYRKYMKGETTKYLKDSTTNTYMVWESLVDDNIGNDPLLSRSWILSKKFLDFKTHIIYINTNPNNTGSTLTPNSQVTVNSASNITFNINEGLGYGFDSVNLLDEHNNPIELVEGVDYTYTDIETDTEYVKSVNISDWSEIVDEESEKYSNNIVFNFVESPSILKLKFNKGNTIYDFPDIQDLGFDLSVSIGGVDYPIPQDGRLIIEHPELNPPINMNYSGSLILRNLIANSRLGSTFSRSNIPINHDNNSIDSIVDFSESTYMFYLNSRNREVIIISNNSNFDITSQSSEVEYGNSFDLRFSVLPRVSVRPRPRLVIFTFYRDSGDIIRYGYSETFVNTPQNNIEVPGPDEPTIVDFERIPGETQEKYNIHIGNVNNNIIIYLD